MLRKCERTDGQTDGQTDGRTDRRMDGQGDCNMPPLYEWGYNIHLSLKASVNIVFKVHKISY